MSWSEIHGLQLAGGWRWRWIRGARVLVTFSALLCEQELDLFVKSWLFSFILYQLVQRLYTSCSATYSTCG